MALSGKKPVQRSGFEEFDAFLEQYHLADAEFVKGNPEPYKMIYSHREDAILGNPFGPFARGWNEISATLERAASFYRDGEILGYEELAKYEAPALSSIVEVVRGKAKIGGGTEITPFSLRTTSVLRREDGTWKVVHRHADPITSARAPQSVIPK